MKLATIGAFVLLLPSPFIHSEQQNYAKATIEGIVVRAGTGEPLAKAQVTLIATQTGGAGAASAAERVTGRDLFRAFHPSVKTDSSGRFIFANVEAGSYRIAAARNGYVRQEYGQRLLGGQGRILTLDAGQTIKEIAFQLLPAGNLSGVVKDPAGEPLAGCQVQLLRVGYNQAGQRIFQAVGSDRTNDRGEYRVYWVTPGRYYLSVNPAASAHASVILIGSSSPNETVERPYPTTFYPGTIDVTQASVIEVHAGADVNADILIPQQDLFHLRGRVIDPSTGLPPRAASVSIVRRGPAAAPTILGIAPAYNPADGTFDLGDVPPGAYWVRAIVSGNSADTVLPASAAGRQVSDFFLDAVFGDRQTSQVAVDVSSDVDNLVLSLGSGVTIRGRLSVEGGTLAAVGSVDRIQVTLRPATPGMLMNPARGQRMREDGAFTAENVVPGEYFVMAQPLPADYYVKEAQLEQVDVLDRPLVVTGAVAGTLNVVLSSKGGRIDGVVVDDRRQPVSGVQAVLVPDANRGRIDLYRTATTDQRGRFSIRGIATGEYKVFAWEAIEPFAYFDSDFVRRFEHLGQRARIVESSKLTLEVNLIPASVQ